MKLEYNARKQLYTLEFNDETIIYFTEMELNELQDLLTQLEKEVKTGIKRLEKLLWEEGI